MPAAEANWKVGTLTVPSSPGDVSVTGLGGTPSALFLYGTNWLTEDTAVTTSGTGLFRGMVAPQFDAPGTLLQSCAAITPAAGAYLQDNYALFVFDTSLSGALLYRATVDFDVDGFTASFDQAASGGYEVVYVALMGVTNAAAYRGMLDATGSNLDFGFNADASLLHAAFNAVVAGSVGYTAQAYGGAAYPDSPLSWSAAGSTLYALPAFNNQGNIGLFNLDPTTSVAESAHGIGPFLVVSSIVAYPSGTDFTFGGDEENGGMVVAWDDDISTTGRITPAASTGGTNTVSGLPFAPGLVIGYSISDEPDGGTNGTRGAIGFSVATRDFQWCAIVDGFDRGAFQSQQRGMVDAINTTNVHAGTVELTQDGFIVTTEEDDTTASDWVWHAFGFPERVVRWIPQIYRRVYGPDAVAAEETPTLIAKLATSPRVGASGSGTSYVFYGFALLETGDQVILEDGSGFLLL